MVTVALALLIGALSTAEICAAPIAGGRGEPEFCSIAAAQRIETPYLSLVVDSEMLVGIDQDGRRVSIQFSLWQNQAGLLIYVTPLDDLESHRPSLQGLNDYLAGRLTCNAASLTQTAWQRCVPDAWNERYLSQYYFLRTATDLYHVDHYASELGRSMDPVIARILASLTAVGSDP